MDLLGDLLNPISLVGDLVGGSGGGANPLGEIGNLAEGVLGGAGGPLGLLGGAALGPVGGILGSLLGGILGGNQGCSQSPAPFSPACGNDFCNDPSQFSDSLDSASDKLGSGLDSLNDFSDIQSLENQANKAIHDAAANPNDPLAALKKQEALQKLQLAVSEKSTDLKTFAQLDKTIIGNSALT